MMTGPVGIRFAGLQKPKLETGEIAGYDLPTPERVSRWLNLAPSIGDDLFLKLYTHGAQDRNLMPLLDEGLPNLYRWLKEETDKRGMEVYWTTAWQMYQAADAVIHGRDPLANSG